MNQQEILAQIAAYTPYDEREKVDQANILWYGAQFENLLWRENPAAHFSATAFVVNEAGDKVLMVHHNLFQSWCWPGGHADGEGDLLGVALRELWEETGLQHPQMLLQTPFAVDILPVWGYWKKGQFFSGHQHLNVSYLCKGDDSLPLRHLPEENSAVAWVPVNEVIARSSETYMHPVYERLLEKARAMGIIQ